MPEENNDKLREKLREAVETIDVGNALTEPLKKSIQDLLELSTALMKSGEASVIVRDGDEGDLIFLTATGKVADQLTGMKIPAGKGIAGFVFSSGQPMSITDVGQAKSFYAEVDRKTGYSTQMVMATPLRYNGEMIGVLEFVNRADNASTESFTPAEMDNAALFADAIASLVYAYESGMFLQEFSKKILIKDETENIADVRGWLQEIRGSGDYREMIDLAVLVREIAGQGEAERILCRKILESVADFAKGSSATSFLNY